jgi:hypothetical protein
VEVRGYCLFQKVALEKLDFELELELVQLAAGLDVVAGSNWNSRQVHVLAKDLVADLSGHDLIRLVGLEELSFGIVLVQLVVGLAVEEIEFAGSESSHLGSFPTIHYIVAPWDLDQRLAAVLDSVLIGKSDIDIEAAVSVGHPSRAIWLQEAMIKAPLKRQ